MNNSILLAAYFRQQKELGMPDPVLENGAGIMLKLRALSAAPAVPLASATRQQRFPPGTVPSAVRAAATASPAAATNPFSRLTRLTPVVKSQASAPALSPGPETTPVPDGPLTFEQKRALFKELFMAQCSRCPLSRGRKSFVFGAGNVDAPLMIIGEAPGMEEDQQGLPFVGPAGKLLTEMLAAVSIDRKKDVFITNILKCRPPGNRNPESAEILACLPLLDKQIAIVRPKLLLLLGRIAAHSLLGTADSISKMRGKVHTCRGIPAIVTYHPAAILRNSEYRKPTDEDMQKIAPMLKESNHNGAS